MTFISECKATTCKHNSVSFSQGRHLRCFIEVSTDEEITEVTLDASGQCTHYEMNDD